MSATSSTLSRRTVLAASAAAGAANLLPGAAIAADNTDERTAIRPFSFRAPEPALAEMRRRVSATIWPEQETVADASQGVQLATMQKLARYWATDYDWRKVEARLNALPNFITEIDGLDIHFIHVRSKHENALPMIVTHGWPGSIIEQLKIIDPLTNPTAHGGSAADAFHLVIPSMPGYGFSGKPPTTGWDPERIATRLDRADEAPRLHEVRGAGRRLGRAHRRADGRAGAAGIARHPHQHGRRGSGRNRQGGLHRRTCAGRTSPSEELRGYDHLADFYKNGLAYAQEMGNRPQTLYGIADSPVGLAAWILDHDIRSYKLIARVFDGQAGGPDARRHPRQHHALLADEHGDLLGAPLLGEQAGLRFPEGRRYPGRRERLPGRDLSRCSRSWAEQAYPKLIHYNKLPKGDHFAAWEQPELFVGEMRAAFKSLRKPA